MFEDLWSALFLYNLIDLFCPFLFCHPTRRTVDQCRHDQVLIPGNGATTSMIILSRPCYLDHDYKGDNKSKSHFKLHSQRPAHFGIRQLLRSPCLVCETAAKLCPIPVGRSRQTPTHRGKDKRGHVTPNQNQTWVYDMPICPT